MAWEEDYSTLALEYEEQCKDRIEKLYKEKDRRLWGRPITDDTWTTMDGTVMKMCMMTDQHIENAIKYFERLLLEISCCDETQGE